MRKKGLVLGALLLLAGIETTACAVVAQPTRARVGQLIGVFEEPTSEAVRIRMGNKETRDIRIDVKTQYTKWLTHQPWTIDRLVNEKSMTIGRCVKVTLRNDQPRAARRVEINLDPPGTPYDPCRSIR